MVVKRVGPMSFAKIQGALAALIGLIIGLIFAAVASLGSALGASSPSSGSMGFIGAAFGVGAIIILPIMYGVCGFIFGLIWAAVYNLLAGVVGGIQVDIS